MRLEPQRARGSTWIKSGCPPPRGFVAVAMDFAVVASAQRNRELITDLSPESPGLGETQMMQVGRHAAAD